MVHKVRLDFPTLYRNCICIYEALSLFFLLFLVNSAVVLCQPVVLMGAFFAFDIILSVLDVMEVEETYHLTLSTAFCSLAASFGLLCGGTEIKYRIIIEKIVNKFPQLNRLRYQSCDATWSRELPGANN